MREVAHEIPLGFMLQMKPSPQRLLKAWIGDRDCL